MVGGSVHSIKEVLKIIEKITIIKNKISFKKPQKVDVLKTESDITDAKEVIRFEPKIKLIEGLFKQISWVKNQI